MEYYCPTCKKVVTMKKIGCGCSKNKKYFCECCRKAYSVKILQK